jgi:hypothetical protein
MPVVFFDGEQNQFGFTLNLSRKGLAMSGKTALRPGTATRAYVLLPGGQPLHFEATVQWAFDLIDIDGKQSDVWMGLRFASPLGPAYDAFLRGAL